MQFQICNGYLMADLGRPLTKEDFDEICTAMGATPGRAKKIGDKPTAAMRIVDVPTEIVTINTKDGSVQATTTAQPGDAIMTRLNKDASVVIGVTGQPDQWLGKAELLKPLYNPLGQTGEYGVVVGGNNLVQFVRFPQGGKVSNPANWGPGVQQTSDGVLQYSETTGEVYLNEEDGFSTFRVLEEPRQT